MWRLVRFGVGVRSAFAFALLLRCRLGVVVVAVAQLALESRLLREERVHDALALDARAARERSPPLVDALQEVLGGQALVLEDALQRERVARQPAVEPAVRADQFNVFIYLSDDYQTHLEDSRTQSTSQRSADAFGLLVSELCDPLVVVLITIDRLIAQFNRNPIGHKWRCLHSSKR